MSDPKPVSVTYERGTGRRIATYPSSDRRAGRFIPGPAKGSPKGDVLAALWTQALDRGDASLSTEEVATWACLTIGRVRRQLDKLQTEGRVNTGHAYTGRAFQWRLTRGALVGGCYLAAPLKLQSPPATGVRPEDGRGAWGTP